IHVRMSNAPLTPMSDSRFTWSGKWRLAIRRLRCSVDCARPRSLGRWFLRLPWSAASPDRDRDDRDDPGDDPGDQEGIAQETSKESGGADRDVAPEVPISVEPRTVDERAGLVSNCEVVLEGPPERAGIGVALVRVDDRVVVVVDEPVVVSSIQGSQVQRDVFSDLDREVRTRARQRRVREAPARAPSRVEVGQALCRRRRGCESDGSEQEAREHNCRKRSWMDLRHGIPPRSAARASLGDKSIGLTSCDLQKRSLPGIRNVLRFAEKRANKEGCGRGRFRARFVHCGGGGGVPGLPIRRQKNAAKAITATMITITPTTIRTVFSPPSSGGGVVCAARIVMLPHMVARSSPGPAVRSLR